MKMLQSDICQNFYRYERIRRSGKYNMIMDWELAAKDSGLNREAYTKAVKKYSHIKAAIIREYGDIEKLLKSQNIVEGHNVFYNTNKLIF